MQKGASFVTQRRKVLVTIAVLLAAAIVVLGLFVAKKRKADYEMESYQGIAMGTIVSMKLYDDQPPTLCKQTKQWIDALEQIISRRIETSPVAVLNRTGRCENSVVASVVRQCEPISAATNGAFDLTIGEVSALWDFGGEHERLPAQSEIEKALKTVGYTSLKTNGDTVSAKSGQALDLGAVGKGLACDRVKEALQKSGIKGGVVSVGGSIVAFGSRNKAGEPWRIAIRHPRNDNALLGTILLKEGFVSTSGDYERFFEQAGKRYFHILDARTGYPVQTDLCSVTVVCNNGLLSDALSTACFLLGEENSEALLKTYDAAAVFVKTDGTISTYGDVDFTAYES